MADVNVHAGLQVVVPENLGEGVGEFVAAVGVSKLKAVPAEHEPGIRILNGDSRRCRRSRRKIEVIVAAVVETEFIDRSGVE